jgi:hypothetical protein
MDPGDVARFESIAGDLLEELGYERAASPGVIARLSARKARAEVLARDAARTIRRRRKTAATFRRASLDEGVGPVPADRSVPPEETLL